MEITIKDIGIIILCLLIGGYLGYTQTKCTYPKQEIEGLWSSDGCDFKGEWIHIKISNITYDRALEVCRHEVGHEMFAEICEKNFTKCKGVLN